MSERQTGNCCKWRAIVLCGLAYASLLLGGCAFNQVFTPEVHKVHRGESLSSIAAEYGLDWRDLARWNRIEPPYTIHVGQRLSLDPFPPLDYDQMQQQRRKVASEHHPNDRSTVTAMPTDRGPQVSRLPSGNKPAVTQTQDTAIADTVTTAAQQATSAGTSASNSDSATLPQQPRQQADQQNEQEQEPPLTNAQGWRWPLAASVLDGQEAERTRHGMNLYGRVGTPVYAARAGQVVYSGAGLQGFGQLVIIKHDDHYLSAYGYVRKAQVEEGNRIAVGQHIADMGNGPGNQAILHFEVRHDGEPIDPQSVLPQR